MIEMFLAIIISNSFQSLKDSENITYTSKQANASLDTANLNSWVK